MFFNYAANIQIIIDTNNDLRDKNTIHVPAKQ